MASKASTPIKSPGKRFLDCAQRNGVEMLDFGFSHAADTSAAVLDERAPCHAQPGFRSWTNAHMGLFVSNTGPCEFAFRAKTSCDILVAGVGVDPSQARTFHLPDTSRATSSGTAFMVLPRGSVFEVNSGEHGLHSVTLIVATDWLKALCDQNDAATPEIIGSASRRREPVFQDLAPSFSVLQLAREIYAPTSTCAFDFLHYQAKSLELLSALMNTLVAQPKADAPRAQLNAVEYAAICRVASKIEEDLTRDTAIDDYAALAGMNRTKLRALFKQVYGVTISDFRNAVIMRRAHRLLRNTTLPIKSIGHQLGYKETSSFSVAYRRYFGMSPKNERVHH